MFPGTSVYNGDIEELRIICDQAPVSEIPGIFRVTTFVDKF